MKTTAEIIEALQKCISKNGSCSKCSYRNEKLCREKLKRDAMHRLIQLETVRKTIKTTRKRGKWIRDKEYESKHKSRYICSVCRHYVFEKKDSEKMHYMNYCSFCGTENEIENDR